MDILEICIASYLAIKIISQIIIDEDESDDENVIVLEKTAHFAEYTVYNFNDKQFIQHFRLLPTTLEVLLQHIHNANDDLHIIHKGQPEISIEKQMLMSLWCLANVECFRSVGDRFGVGKSTCWRILYRSCHRLLNVNNIYNIISFPMGDRAIEIINSFQNINGFPGVLGVIDGCHIRIDKPQDHPNSYINRKGYPSVILQGVCDHRKLFLDVYVGQPGSLNDLRVFTKSDLHERIIHNQVEFPNDSHLIGDLAYKLSTTLMVGFKEDRPRTPHQLHFNQRLSQVRVVIENAFGLLKGRFRRLKMMETKRMDLIALLVEHYVEDDDYEVIIDDREIDNPEAIAKRNNIVNYLYQ